MPGSEKQAVSSSRISTRISLRWTPEPASETTDTTVMSVKDWYVDLRVDKQTGEIDWAIAGQRIVESKEPLRILFTHELDSHNAFNATDCGTFKDLPNGDSLETGSMARHDLPGAPMSDYEEVWRELTPREGPDGSGGGYSWILESEDAGLSSPMEREITVAKTFLGCIWGTYIALRQTQTLTGHRGLSGKWEVRKSGRDVSVRCEEWHGKDGWREKYVIGADGGSLPSLASGFDRQGTALGWSQIGQRVVIQETPFTVRAYEQVS